MMPTLAKRLVGNDRRRDEQGASSGIDRRRCAERRREKVSPVPMSDAEWHKYLEMPNLLEIPVEAPNGMQIKAIDLRLLSPKKT
jgi:hypothetical protein